MHVSLTLELAHYLLLAHVQHPHLYVTGLANTTKEEMESPPSALETLELHMVQDFIQLQTKGGRFGRCAR